MTDDPNLEMLNDAETNRALSARIDELEAQNVKLCKAHQRITSYIWTPSIDPTVLGMIIEEMRATSRAALQLKDEAKS